MNPEHAHFRINAHGAVEPVPVKRAMIMKGYEMLLGRR